MTSVQSDGDSMSSTPTSEASTKVDHDPGVALDEPKGPRRRAWQRAKDATTSRDILLFLIAFRILNALSIRTFFQPDEYFQSLEPAWDIAFGRDSGAWIAWVSSLCGHPYIAYGGDSGAWITWVSSLCGSLCLSATNCLNRNGNTT